MIAKDTTIRLMIVDDSVEEAEASVSALRNGGIAVRPLRPQDASELATMLAGQAIDLVLASRSAKGIAYDTLLAQVAGSGKDIPVVALVDALDEEEWVGALAKGARAIALRQRPEQLLAVLRAQWSDLEARRALRLLEAQLRETERRCDALIDSSRDPIAYIHEGMHIRANQAYLEMFDFETFDDVEGLSLLDLVAPQHVDGFKQLLKSMSKGEPPPAQYAMEARSLDGTTFPATMEFAQASYEGEACVQVVFRRREFDPELAQEIEDLRQRDLVSGLLNRPTFMHALENAVAEVARSDSQYGFLLVEPDHYARLLPEIGLDSADPLIAGMAAHLRAALGEDVQAARFGEHTFAVLMKGNHARTAAASEKIRDAFAAHVFSVGDRSATVTVSLGGVQIGEKIASVGQVLARGTESLRAAVDLGGNSVQIFDPGAVDRAEEERVQRWVGRLQDALAGDGFVLHYQPVISLQGEGGGLYEALLRIDAGGELVSPNAFLGIAEEHHLLADLDRWVVARAIELLAEQQAVGRQTRLLVKVSPTSFGDSRLAELIAAKLAEHGVPGERLWLETPEAKVFTHLKNAQQFLAAVSALGCKVGLERFGSGLDSFQLLAHFQPTFVKLDRAFTEDAAQAAEQLDKIREISDRAKAAGMETIAEFVQDATTMSLMFSAGVDYVEGHFVAAPGPAMNFDFD